MSRSDRQTERLRRENQALRRALRKARRVKYVSVPVVLTKEK